MSRQGWAWLSVLALLGTACAEEVVTSSNTTAAPVDRKALLVADAGTADGGLDQQQKVEFQELEFGENERSRDPFRSFLNAFVEEDRVSAKSQRQVLLEDYSIDELRLIGIVSGIPDPTAMLVDPQGRGHVLRRGQFLGRAEIVHGDAQGAPAYEVNWRVDRVRDSDVVLVREDPNHPEVPTTTRVLPLHPDGQLTPEIELPR